MAVAFQKTILLPCISSVEKAKEFNSGFLGFAVDWALPVSHEASA
jgi:Glyoxalase superfamily protein